MDKIITFCYRKIIDKNSTRAWDKLVFADSHREFKMQAQNFNRQNQHTGFGQILQHNADAERLHGLVGPSVLPYIRQLNEVLPDIGNNLGKRFLSFKNYRFEIINSDINQIEKHQVAINFFTEPMLWLDTVDRYLLLSEGENENGEHITHLLEMQPYLSINTLKNHE